MSERSKLRMICNPYEKKIEYLWYQSDIDRYMELNQEKSKLAREYRCTTIQNSAYKIAKTIDKECNVGNVGLDIEFVGTNDDYEYFKGVINTQFGEHNIKCIQETAYYRSASEVMPEIKKEFEKVIKTLDDYKEDDIEESIKKYNDVVKPAIPLCVVGLYSAGKSTFIDSVVGAEILPSSSDPTTATVCKITCSKNYSIKFLFDDIECILTFEGKNYTANINCSVDIINELQSIVGGEEPHDEVHHMNAALTIINKYKKKEKKENKHTISDKIEIEVPFVQKNLPVDEFEFIIYDTPGTNSETYQEHFELLKKSLGEQTNALPIYLTTPEQMDAKDNNELINSIKEMETALDLENAIIVVNKSDEKGKKDLCAKRDNISNLSITNWKSDRIFFVSSLIGLASKKVNPAEERQWIDEDLYEQYEDKKYRYVNDERKLYEYNIIDESKVGTDQSYGEDDPLTTHLYKNSGLEAVEKIIAEYAKTHAALYNKCHQASLYLQDAINKCSDKVKKVEEDLEKKWKEADASLTKQQQELCKKLDSKKKEIGEYNREFQQQMQETYEKYTAENHIVEGDLYLRDELKKKWKEYRENEKDKKKENRADLGLMQDYVERRYNNLLKAFSESINNQINKFWMNKSTVFKNGCMEIVRGSKDFSAEQRNILESVVRGTNCMDTYSMIFDLRKMGAIRNKKFLIWTLKSEKFDAKVCASNLISAFNDSVGKRINSVEVKNENCFMNWTDRLIAKIKEKIREFNPKLAALNKEVNNLNAEKEEKSKCEKMLKEHLQSIEKLLDMQE